METPFLIFKIGTVYKLFDLECFSLFSLKNINQPQNNAMDYCSFLKKKKHNSILNVGVAYVSPGFPALESH